MKVGKVLSFIACAVSLTVAQTGDKLPVGTTQSVLNSVVKQKTRATSDFSLISSSAKELPLKVRDYYLEDGILSLTGKASDEDSSNFILKGSADEIYGWVVYHEKGVAYEYTTDSDKNVIVTEVPVTKIFPVCDIDGERVVGEPHDYRNSWPTGPEPHIGDYDGQNVNELESRPGCPKVFYLDITDIMNGDEPITTAPNNLQSKAEVYKLWQSVAAGFSNFEMNVTTNRAVYDAAGIPNSGIAKFYNKDGRSFSPLNAFGTTQASTNYRNNGQGYGIGRTAFHEIGHTMGMDHDRGDNGSTEYYPGIADHQWCPIMGNYWYANSWEQALFQWSKSEYTGGSTFEDDLARVNRYVEYCEDDIPNSVELALDGETIDPLMNRGQIATTGDEDRFTFEVGNNGGHLTLHVDRTEYIGGAMLDVALSLQDENGTEIAFDNPVKARYADLDEDLEPGIYSIVVTGGADGTPQHGFPNYSSLGYYAMEGTLTGAVSVSKHSNCAHASKLTPEFAGEYVKLNIPTSANVNKISVYSLNGSQVFSSNKRVESIDFSKFATGVYTIHVKMDGVKITEKIIKK